MMKLMSRFFTMLALLVCAATFTACGDDDDPTTPPPGGETKTPVVEYSIQVSADALEVADVVVTYMNVGGVELTDTLKTTDTWKLKFTPTSSQKVGFKVTATAKAGIDTLLTKDRYTFGSAYTYVTYQVKSNGVVEELMGMPSPGDTKMTIKADQVKDYLSGKAVHVCKSRSASYDKEQNKFTDWENTY